jgi:hypothetical protein
MARMSIVRNEWGVAREGDQAGIGAHRYSSQRRADFAMFDGRAKLLVEADTGTGIAVAAKCAASTTTLWAQRHGNSCRQFDPRLRREMERPKR